MKTQKFLVRIIVYLITGYQYAISPNLPKVCRFYPTCSEYSRQAFVKYGLFKGLLLSVKRILRCNPFFQGGYDPVDPALLKHIRIVKFSHLSINPLKTLMSYYIKKGGVDPQSISQDDTNQYDFDCNIIGNNTAKEMRFSK